MSFEQDLREIIRRAEEAGWEVRKSRHWWLFFWPGFRPLEDRPCQIGGTGHSRGHALGNLRACLKRHGLNV